jgi:hypothetical protein
MQKHDRADYSIPQQEYAGPKTPVQPINPKYQTQGASDR